jgi:hypothetical protein
VYIYARAAQLRGVARGNLSKNSFLEKSFKKGGRDRHHKNQVPFWSTQVPFWYKKRRPLFWAMFWLPKVKKAGPFFLQKGRSLFAQVPIFGPAQKPARGTPAHFGEIPQRFNVFMDTGGQRLDAP